MLESKYLKLNRKNVRYPHATNELDGKLAYLVGVIAGDGHIENDMNEMKVVDGHPDKQQKKYSRNFLNKIDQIIYEHFGCTSYIEKMENYLVFRYNSTVLCRMLNYIYNVPSGDKSRIIMVPSILKDKNVEALFWRGMFDADGSIRPKHKAIRLSTTSNRLYMDFLYFCKQHEISLFTKIKDPQYHILVIEEGIENFAKKIGSMHPRKQRNLIGYLMDGASYQKPKNKKQNRKLDRIIRYLRPYKDSVYIKLTDNREGITKETIRNRMNNIKKIVKHKIIKIKKLRRNDQHYICSKRLLTEIRDCYEFVPLWRPFEKIQIDELKERWDNYE